MAEKWRKTKGYPGYEASDTGRVRSFWKQVGSPDFWAIAAYERVSDIAVSFNISVGYVSHIGTGRCYKGYDGPIFPGGRSPRPRKRMTVEREGSMTAGKHMENITIIPQDYIGVRVAAERSGYTRTHIHNLANWDIIGSEMVTPSFRLVSWPDIATYMKAHPRKRPASAPEPVAAEEAQ